MGRSAGGASDHGVMSTAKLPNFFIAGAPTAGTTSLHHYLRQHPQVYMSPIKEPTFFAAADMLSRDAFRRPIERDRAALRAYLAGPRERTANYWVSEWPDYVQLFRDVRDEVAIGEASVSYFWLPSAAPAIRAMLPEARFIFLLRNPADRLFSWYLMNLERDPRLTFRAWFLEARDAGGDGGPAPEGRYTLPLDGGWCSTHLQRFFDAFPRDQIGVWLYDRFCADPRSVVQEIFAFLDVDPAQPIDMSRRLNETATPRFPGVHTLRRRVLGDRPVARWLPDWARRSLRRLYRRRRASFAIDPADRRMVIDYYQDDILRTADLVGRDLSAWLR
jgi:hypothetical protein